MLIWTMGMETSSKSNPTELPAREMFELNLSDAALQKKYLKPF